MTAHTSNSIVRRHWRCVVAAPAALAAIAITLHVANVRTARTNSERQDVRLFAEAASLGLRALAPDDSVAQRRWCDQLTESPGVLAASLFDGTGRQLAASGIVDPLVQSVAPVEPATDLIDIADYSPPHRIAANLPPLCRVGVTLSRSHNDGRAAQAVLVMSPSHLATVSGDPSGNFIGGILFAWVVATVFVIRHTRAAFAGPLADLVELTSAGTRYIGKLQLEARRDEWGKIARCIDDLRAEVGNVRDHVERIERRADQQIAEETRRIARDIQRLELQSSLDPLTKLMNRRVFDEKLPAIFAAQQGCGSDLSVIMMDLDRFKNLNDTAGHAAGDDVLEVAGQLLAQCARSQDVAIRYGGDEFLLILPGVRADDANRIAVRLVAMFTQQVKVMFPGSGVSMSAGVAGLLAHRPATPTALVEMADEALYDAKRAGRRCVRQFGRKTVAA